MRRSNSLATLGFVLVFASGLAQAQTTYRITDLGTLGGTSSHGSAINASGQVTGYGYTTGNAASHAFLWDGTAMVDLGTLGGTSSYGVAINASGQVTGSSELPGNAVNHAFVWNGTTIRDLNLGGTRSSGPAINASGQVAGYGYTAGDAAQHAFIWDGTTIRELDCDSTAYGINAFGQVTGHCFSSDFGGLHAYLWDGTTLRDLGTLGGSTSFGLAINDSGQVTGRSTVYGSGYWHAFLWNGTVMQDLGTLGGTLILPAAINASGRVTGWAYVAGDVARHAFLWDGTTLRDLGTLGGTYSWGYAINASGQVTGTASTTGDAGSHAFLWDGTTMRDLNALVDSGDPLKPYVTLYDGQAINDLGQIAANGADSRTGQQHAYLVSPSDTTSGQTPSGSGVAITPVVTLPGGATTTVEMTFGTVQSGGVTSVTAASTPGGGAPASAPNFKAGSPPVYYDVTTTASFTGAVTLCFSWTEGQFNNENNIRLFHFESGVWMNVTTTLNTAANKVCGQVSSLSPFALFETSYVFTGFFSPVDNLPTRNIVKAGSGIPVKFKLNGNQGLSIFAAGYPVSQAVACTSGTPSDSVEETIEAGGSSLTYDASSGTYTYVWKTQKTWSNSCRRLSLKLIDGSEHAADFGFPK